jgi:hypothetical protein
VHWFKHPPWEQKDPSEATAKSVRVERLPPAPPQVAMADRFVNNGDGTVTGRKTGLMWIKNGWRIEFLAAVSWDAAMKKCAGFRAGNHTDWRLPTVEEWRSLVDRSVSYPALVEPNPYHPRKVTGYYSDSRRPSFNPERRSTRALTAALNMSSFVHISTARRARVMPV